MLISTLLLLSDSASYDDVIPPSPPLETENKQVEREASAVPQVRCITYYNSVSAGTFVCVIKEHS